MRKRKVATLAATACLLAACGSSKHHSPSVGTGDSADAAMPHDAGKDAAPPAVIMPPPPPPLDAGHDAGKPDASVGARDAGVTPCDARTCRGMSDECNLAHCDTVTQECKLEPRQDGIACGSSTLDNCTIPDTCQAGVCAPNDKPKGTPCGDQGKDCNFDDECDGNGQCTDKGVWTTGTACGDQTIDTACDRRDSCDAQGVCQKNLAAQDAPCGDQGKACHFDDTCNGQGQCVDSGLMASGAACGDPSNTACRQPDTCDSAGACMTHFTPQGTSCGSQSLTCATDASCDGAGACAYTGLVSPCTLTGTITAGGAGLAGILVEVLGSSPLSTTTDQNGNLQLAVPLLQELVFHVTDAPGYYGQVVVRTLTPENASGALDFNLLPDGQLGVPAAALGLSVDLTKGVVQVAVAGASLVGTEGASIGAQSAPAIIFVGGNAAYSSTIMSTTNGALFFYNVALGSTTVTPTNTCTRNATSVTQFPVFAHTLTSVGTTCR